MAAAKIANPVDSGDAKSFIKSKWIANQMKERSNEFTTLSDIKVGIL